MDKEWRCTRPGPLGAAGLTSEEAMRNGFLGAANNTSSIQRLALKFPFSWLTIYWKLGLVAGWRVAAPDQRQGQQVLAAAKATECISDQARLRTNQVEKHQWSHN